MSTIPEEVKDVVTFIFIKDSLGKLKPNGTGFLVGVKDEKTKGRFFSYLVTAKHVILDPSGQYHSDFFVRLNKISGGSQQLFPLISYMRFFSQMSFRKLGRPASDSRAYTSPDRLLNEHCSGYCCGLW